MCPRRARTKLCGTDEALHSGALKAVITEFWTPAARLELAATKRFNFAAERTGTGCFILTRSLAATSAAVTRWMVRAKPSRSHAYGLISAPAPLELFRADGAVKRLDVACSQPLREPVRITALSAESIGGLNDGLEADFGFDLLRLGAPRPPWSPLTP